MCIINDYRACSSEARARGYELRCRGFDSLLAQSRQLKNFSIVTDNLYLLDQKNKCLTLFKIIGNWKHLFHFFFSRFQFIINVNMGCSQVVRQWTLTPSSVGSNPTTPG